MRRLQSLVGIGSCIALLGAVSSTSPSATLHRRTGTWCNDSDAVVTPEINWLKGMAVATSQRDTSFRSQLHLMAVDPATITYVTDSVACRRAAESMRHEVYGADTGALVPLYLIQYGPTRFYGTDGEKVGEWMGWMIFDSAFTKLGGVAH